MQMLRDNSKLTNVDEFEYRVAKIEYIEREDATYQYRLSPDYSVIGLLGPEYFQGIPGLNPDLHKECYVRENRRPGERKRLNQHFP